MAVKKSDNHEVEQRVLRIYTLLINGYTGAEIVHDNALCSEWSVNIRQMWIYVSRAREMLHEEAGRVREVELGKAIRRYEKMYRRMEAIHDYRGCLSAQSRLDDLLALGCAKRMDITTKGEAINTLASDVVANLSQMDAESIAQLMKAGRE